jgi:proteasome accessory factor C
MNEARDRLRRLLLVVPYSVRHPGATVDELAARLGVEPAMLREDLDKLALVGRPPFSPDDFIDIYVEDDRVYVMLDQRFERPPRLTAPEAAALWASAQLMRPAAKTALASAQEKLVAAVPESARELFERLAERVGSEAAPMDDLLEPLARAGGAPCARMRLTCIAGAGTWPASVWRARTTGSFA